MTTALAVSPPNSPPAPPSAATTTPKIPTFTATLQMSSKAWGDTHASRMAELAKVMQIMVDDIEHGRLVPGGSLTLRDGNGETVGYALLDHAVP